MNSAYYTITKKDLFDLFSRLASRIWTCRAEASLKNILYPETIASPFGVATSTNMLLSMIDRFMSKLAAGYGAPSMARQKHVSLAKVQSDDITVVLFLLAAYTGSSISRERNTESWM